jgi:hypothetical protein
MIRDNSGFISMMMSAGMSRADANIVAELSAHAFTEAVERINTIAASASSPELQAGVLVVTYDLLRRYTEARLEDLAKSLDNIRAKAGKPRL